MTGAGGGIVATSLRDADGIEASAAAGVMGWIGSCGFWSSIEGAFGGFAVPAVAGEETLADGCIGGSIGAATMGVGLLEMGAEVAGFMASGGRVDA